MRMTEEGPAPLTSKGWAEMIRRVYEVDPMICPRCGGRVKAVAFLDRACGRGPDCLSSGVDVRRGEAAAGLSF